MNKKVNTFLFILGATVFNVLVAIICFFLLTFLYLTFIAHLLPEQGHVWSFTFIFLACIVLSILVYRFAVKFLLKKIDVEKYFDPIFIRKNRGPR